MNHVENTPYDYWQLTCAHQGPSQRSSPRLHATHIVLTSTVAGVLRSNIMHGSDSVDSANHEIGMWFTPAELIGWTSHSYNMIYE